MKLFLNIIWLIFGGLLASILWFLLGILLSITIIGIPFALQCFKTSRLMLFPFGSDVLWNLEKHPIANIIWAVLFGWEMTLIYLTVALGYTVTIIGIPFAIQWVKLSKLALLPFGTKIK